MAEGTLRLTLSYRPPLAWESLAELPRESHVAIGAYSGRVAMQHSAADAHLVAQSRNRCCRC